MTNKYQCPIYNKMTTRASKPTTIFPAPLGLLDVVMGIAVVTEALVVTLAALVAALEATVDAVALVVAMVDAVPVAVPVAVPLAVPVAVLVLLAVDADEVALLTAAQAFWNSGNNLAAGGHPLAHVATPAAKVG
jgi:hypothetical protein